ncbi:hypothetical protein AN958_02727 [Leucoagaricus sp. SymC.cos]|nr:hypothetical protein AN958_02727 [Leucoagaricus sp. SymC.cos]
MASPYSWNTPVSGNRSPYHQSSPFIPPANLLSTSPYASPYSSPYGAGVPLPGGSTGGSPYRAGVPLPTGSPNTAPFPLPNTPYYDPNYDHWGRPRRPSYPGPHPDEYAPPWAVPQGRRRNSFSAGPWQSAYPPSPGYWPPQGVYPQYNNGGFDIHPLLNGEVPHSMLLFDLSAPRYQALKYVGPGQTEHPSTEELNQPATWPPSNTLRIECDVIPQWPIAFQLDPNYFGGALPPPGSSIPPITLGDVLSRIYDHFHQRITHADWALLAPEDESRIARAYTARCKALGTAEVIERSYGVKRIDYCLGKVWFRGLTRSGEGMDVLKLHLQKR